MSKNPTTLTLLEQGATITFDDGIVLRGLPADKYIEIATSSGPAGLLHLSRLGVAVAMRWVNSTRQDIKRGLE